jgi:hypothetical protein
MLGSIELRHWDNHSEYFRCFSEAEVVPLAASLQTIESVVDDDCPTDDEAISEAKVSLKNDLEDAILSKLAS